MDKDNIRAAMVGGRGHHFIKAGFGTIEGLTLAAISADGKDETARNYMDMDFCGPDTRYFDDYEKMLDSAKPDVVSVGTWPARNAPFILKALERDIHVIADKPIVNSADELHQVKDALAARPHLLLLTEFDMRTRPVFLAMRDVVRSGRIGEVVLAQGQKSYRFGESRPDYYKTREGFPGTFMFIGCHLVDLTYYVTGLGYTSAQGLQGNVAKKEYGRFEDHAAFLGGLENGGAAVLHADYLRPAAAPTHGDCRLRVIGGNGVVEARDNRCEVITQDDPPTEVCAEGPARDATAIEMVKTLRGEGSGIYSVEDSLYIAGTMLKVREALDSGEKVGLG